MGTAKTLKKSFNRQRGANLVEYALLVSLLLLAGIPALNNIGKKAGVNLCKAAVEKPKGITYHYKQGCMGLSPCGLGYNTYINPDGSPTCLAYN